MANRPASHREVGIGARLVRPRAAIFLVFAVLSIAIQWPALEGPFIGDDEFYIVDNPFIESLDPASVRELFVPGGPASLYVVNYAPLHLLAHGLQRFLFGPSVEPYHVTNALLHALAGLLLVLLLLRSRVASGAALLGGLFFIVHPGNVEAVAQISQLKTTLSTVLALGALLWVRERPLAAAVLFATALLVKASALFALPMAAAFLWSGKSTRAAVWGVVGWGAIFALYAIPEMAAFEYGGRHVEPAYEDPWVQWRSIAAIGLRYLVMAVTSLGIGPLQEPSPVREVFDPGWWIAIAVGAALLYRVVSTLRSRNEEAAWWLGAAAAFAPVSQIFPFIHPVADRYLYPMLPGLIGGALLFGQQWVDSRGWDAATRRFAARAGALVAVLWCSIFAFRGVEQAALWSGPLVAMEAAAERFPDGSIAWYLRGRAAAQAGDASAAVYALRESHRRAEAVQRNFYSDPAMAAIVEDPVFANFARERAGERLESARQSGLETQHWLRVRAHDHLIRGELDSALVLLERALATAGPRDETVRREIEALRAMIGERNRGEEVKPRFRRIGS